MDSLEVSDAASAAVQKTPHRVTLDRMKNKIRTVEFFHPARAPSMTICAMTTATGFVLVGKAAPADPANYNQALGEKFAQEDCLRQMWELEGYLLCERLAAGAA